MTSEKEELFTSDISSENKTKPAVEVDFTDTKEYPELFKRLFALCEVQNEAIAAATMTGQTNPKTALCPKRAKAI